MILQKKLRNTDTDYNWLFTLLAPWNKFFLRNGYSFYLVFCKHAALKFVCFTRGYLQRQYNLSEIDR